MSVQFGTPRRGSPVTTNYRGVTTPVMQQYGPLQPLSVNQGSPHWRRPAVVTPRTGFEAAMPPGKPVAQPVQAQQAQKVQHQQQARQSRPAQQAQRPQQAQRVQQAQPAQRAQPRQTQQAQPAQARLPTRDPARPTTTGHARSRSDVFTPSLTSRSTGSSSPAPPRAPAASRHAAQPRPVSYHAGTPSTKLDAGVHGMFRQQQARSSPRLPVQPPQVQNPAWYPGITPQHPLQQSHAKFLALEKDFQNLAMAVPVRPSSHSRHGSFDSVASSRSGYSRPSSAASQASSFVSVDARDAPVSSARRNYAPSPLALPVQPSADGRSSSASTTRPSSCASSVTGSPTSKKHTKGESKSSKLRKVLSIGSLDDLSKSTRGDTDNGRDLDGEGNAGGVDDASMKKPRAGQRNSIYGSNFFSRSLDNIATSSTANSASGVLKKVGSGMKRHSRSLSGLFRPKSMVVSGSDTPFHSEPSLPVVSPVNAEAEAKPSKGPLPPKASEAFPVIGLGSPRVSLDPQTIPQIPDWPRADSPASPTNFDDLLAKVGKTEQHERATPRRSILKGSNSPVSHPYHGREMHSVPDLVPSSTPSIPSTPIHEVHDPRPVNPYLTSELTTDLESLMDALHGTHDPDEPVESAQAMHAATAKHHASFSPRLVFWDTWTPEEYDRRGEVATCNVLTPKMALQIKNELNRLKTEMEVHEMSKMYTQFY